MPYQDIEGKEIVCGYYLDFHAYKGKRGMTCCAVFPEADGIKIVHFDMDVEFTKDPKRAQMLHRISDPAKASEHYRQSSEFMGKPLEKILGESQNER